MRRAAPPSQRIEVPQFYTAAELASSWKVSRAWIHSLYSSGRLKGTLIGRLPGETRGGVLRFRAEDVDAFLARGHGGDADVR